MNSIRSGLAGLAVAAVFASASPAMAAFFSAYTEIDLDQCTVMNADDFGATWACPGHKGYPLYVAEADQRFRLSYGFDAPREMAASQTPPPFNTLGPRLEWRLSNASGGFKPIATIAQYLVGGGAAQKAGEVLVVTRLGDGQTCHIAYIDALANADAKTLAEQAADGADAFDCARDTAKTIGPFTAW